MTAMRRTMPEDSERARSYFDRLAPEYDRAFHEPGSHPLRSLVNRTFRGATFARRMRLLESLFRDLGLQGRSVLDLGCGSGQVSLLAASMGASVVGVDVAPRMLEIARAAASATGLQGRVRFEEGDAATGELGPADVTLLVGVVEYHRDFAALLRRAATATRRTLVVAHTTRVWYRMLLRRILFALRGASLYFHPMDEVVAAGEAAGLRLARRLDDHAFAVLVFERSA